MHWWKPFWTLEREIIPEEGSRDWEFECPVIAPKPPAVCPINAHCAPTLPSDKHERLAASDTFILATPDTPSSSF
jgi:hypothetical protein